ncbi:MAG: 2-oxo acid dehydrogenase subunit E2 [Pseudomonadota bacterium]|nr:2-oxo acid dehydrogenase subunit E2 [Pseudomonadota bacterium]
MADRVDIIVPDLGEYAEVEIIEVLVSAGESVRREDGLITLETDKATMDVPAPAHGSIVEITVAVGGAVSSGDVIGSMTVEEAPDAVVQMPTGTKPVPEPESSSASPVVTSAPASPPAVAPLPNKLPPIDEAGFSRAHASPSVRKLARELGVDLVVVRGSGPKARVLHDDVKAYVKSILMGASGPVTGPVLPEVPKVDFSKFGPTDVQPLTRIQKISGPRLQASWINLPHVTQHDIADISDLESKRQSLKGPAREKNISLTLLAFIMKACIAALKEFPRVNSSLGDDGKSLVFKQYYHLGFAVDTENGLMVPVIRDADKFDIYELAKMLGILSKGARDGKLKSEQMQGASFTISSLGGIGGTSFTPIVNAPEVAILGVSRSSMQPVWNGELFEPRLMLPISFSYDHRVIDGAYAARFTTFFCQQLANVEALLEAHGA